MSLGSLFSHSLFYLRQHLVSVGGIDHLGRQVGVRAVRADSTGYWEIALPVTVCTNLMMYFNHSAQAVSLSDQHIHLIIIGGGGNCFSFGTHINRHPIMISLDDIF